MGRPWRPQEGGKGMRGKLRARGWFWGVALLLAGCATTPEGVQPEGKAEDYYNLGVAYLNSGEPRRALPELTRATEMAPRQAPYHNALGLAYFLDRNLPEAVKAFQRAVELDPKFADAFNNLGTAYLGQRELPRAEQAFKAALGNTFYPTPQRAHFNLGNVYQQQGRLEEAAAQFRRAVDVDPEFANAHNSLGIVYLAQNKPDLAVTSFEAASRLTPTVAVVQRNLGIAYFRAGKRPEARAALERALKLQPAGPGADEIRDLLRRLR